MIEAKAFRTFIRIYSLFKSERLSVSIKLTLHNALIRSCLGICGRMSPIEIAVCKID
jgi:hypothetical protein